MEIIYAISGLLGGGVLSYFMWDKALKSKKKKIVSEAVAEADLRLFHRNCGAVAVEKTWKICKN